MGALFAELKRRNVYRVAAAYTVAGWLLLQIINNVAPILALPLWISRAFLLLLVVGFVLAVALAWVFELTPEGLKRTRPVSPHALPQVSTTDWILCGALAALIALIAYEEIRGLGQATPAQQAALSVAAPPVQPAQAPAAPGAVSIAVLPFANISNDDGQEFFSDGVTEELTSALAKVPRLRVVARTSAFQFKDRNEDVRTVGRSLGATHLIEGSVRQAGGRVRITAQLVSASDGTHLWTETYDRQLNDIFAIQEDIARTIAAELRLPLGLQQGDALVRHRTDDIESYLQYLRGRSLLRARAIRQAIEVLEPVVERDADFAPAWGTLAQAHALTPVYMSMWQGPEAETRSLWISALQKAEEAGHRAIQLEPRDVTGYTALAYAVAQNRNWKQSEDFFRQALERDVEDPETIHLYSVIRATSGYVREAVRQRQRLTELEPFVPIYTAITADITLISGQRDAAMRMLQAVPARGPITYYRNIALARAYAAAGRFDDAGTELLGISMDAQMSARRSVEDAARLIRTAPAPVANPAALPVLEGNLNFVYAYIGASPRALEFAERALGLQSPLALLWLWDPLYAPLRQTERFKTLVRNAGLVEYWRERGWPDLCRPLGQNDFTCS
jgi:TolB-like protein